jgi:DNA-directed RNA polymerase specialized sigma subunit
MLVTKPLSNKSQRVLDLWVKHKSLPTSAIAERLGLSTVRILQIIHAARKRGDLRAEYRIRRN